MEWCLEPSCGNGATGGCEEVSGTTHFGSPHRSYIGQSVTAWCDDHKQQLLEAAEAAARKTGNTVRSLTLAQVHAVK
jgi:hypothetical protein